MIKYTSDCNGCADCIHCGLNEKRKAVFCDNCKQEICDTVYTFRQYQHLCEDCAYEMLESAPVEYFTEDDT